MNRAVRILMVCLCLIIAAGAGTLVLFYNLNKPVDSIPEGGVVFTVETGDALAAVAQRLENDDLIRSHLFFQALGRIYRTDGKMKTGLYRIESGFSTMEVHNLLVSGTQVLFKVTIPEGWTSGMIGSLLEEEGITTQEEFLQACETPALVERVGAVSGSIEGFLYPDTYYFTGDYPAPGIVEYMVDTFFTSLEEIFPEWEELSREDLYERVILASIVEREYRDSSEAPLMASVFYNRLEKDMFLGSCATVVYALTEEMGEEHPERLTYSDLEVESAYNTYRNRGLPPGPISNPGNVALDAAFNPEQSDYLYFVLKDPEAGRHHFSRSLGEHNQAYTLYIKRGY